MRSVHTTDKTKESQKQPKWLLSRFCWFNWDTHNKKQIRTNFDWRNRSELLRGTKNESAPDEKFVFPSGAEDRTKIKRFAFYLHKLRLTGITCRLSFEWTAKKRLSLRAICRVLIRGRITKNKNESALHSRLFLVTRSRIELLLPPWKGGVLTAWPTGLVAEVGLEPTTYRVWTDCSSQLSYSAIFLRLLEYYIIYSTVCQ